MTRSDLSIQSATNGTQLWDMNAPTTPHGKAFARAFDLGRAMVQDLDGRICFWSTVHELPDHVVVLDAGCRPLGVGDARKI